jgi:hypothetical protein
VKLHLAAAIKRRSRRAIVLPNIAPTQAQADDLARIYLRVVAMWREGAAGIVAEYERTLGEMTTDSAGSTGGAIDGVQVQVNRLLLSLDPALRDWVVRVERVLTGKWVRGVLSATDVDLSTVLSPSDVSDTVEAVLEWNTSLIRDLSDELRPDALRRQAQLRSSAQDQPTATWSCALGQLAPASTITSAARSIPRARPSPPTRS